MVLFTHLRRRPIQMPVDTWDYHATLALRAAFTDLNWLGCMTQADFERCYYNGSTALRAKRPARTKTFLEQNNIFDPTIGASMIKHRDWCLSEYSRDHQDAMEARRAYVLNRDAENVQCM